MAGLTGLGMPAPYEGSAVHGCISKHDDETSVIYVTVGLVCIE